MTILKRKHAAHGASETPTFGSVWKVVIGVFSGVATIAIAAMFTWLWNTNNAITSLVAAAESLAKVQTAIESRVDRGADIIATHAAQLAVLAANNQTLSERLRSMEQQQMWRERLRDNQRSK